MGHKRVHRKAYETCIVHTVVCLMAPVRLKHHRIVEKIKPVALAIIELCLCLKESLSEAVSRQFH